VRVCFGENHVKLEMKKNSVIGGRMFIIYALMGCKLDYGLVLQHTKNIRFNGIEYLRNYSCKP
jgi:hypothetical protein